MRARLVALPLLLALSAAGPSACAADDPTGQQRPESPQRQLLSEQNTITQFAGTGTRISTTVRAADISRVLGEQSSGSGGMTVTVSCTGADSGRLSIGAVELGVVRCSTQPDTAEGMDTVTSPKDAIDLGEDQELVLAFDSVATATVTVQLDQDANTPQPLVTGPPEETALPGEEPGPGATTSSPGTEPITPERQ